jgi:hypothetical protein
MPTLMSFLLRLFLLIAGLVFAASLAVAAVLMLGAWSIRALWAKLTGRPVEPFAVRMNRFNAFGRMYRRAPQESSRTPRADAVVRPGRHSEDVTDVQAREPRV